MPSVQLDATAPELAASWGAAARRARGAYYTPSDAAEYLAAWATRGDRERILEPSSGAGVFLDALSAVAEARHWTGLRVTAVELDSTAFEETTIARPHVSLAWKNQDFLGLDPIPHDSVLGNPPYVRLRHLSASGRATALRTSSEVLGVPMDPSGSSWMPFVVHATRWVRIGGRMALVLPYEMTYVRYARPLWEFLGRSYGSLRIVRTKERLFPEILQEVVLFFADDRGGHTSAVQFDAYDRFQDLVDDKPLSTARLEISDIVSSRPFVSALLPAELRNLLATKIAQATRPASTFADFRIGYVSGDKNFFQPSAEAVRQYGLPEASMRPAVASARKLRGKGLWMSQAGREALSQLFLPNPQALNDGERRYIRHGETLGVHERYKCSIRKPWYVVPYVQVPDLILTVFSEAPLLLVNDAEVVASNSLMCGFLRNGHDADTFASQWYTSLTLLSLEMQVHSLGGGVFVLVPREASAVRIVEASLVRDANPSAVGRLLSHGHTEDAYRVGDDALVTGGHFTAEEIDLVAAGAAALKEWRTTARASTG